jgi:hypothetical protein
MNSTPVTQNVLKHVKGAPSNTFLTCFSYQPENSFSGLWAWRITKDTNMFLSVLNFWQYNAYVNPQPVSRQKENGLK